ncbi:DNA phosphorothioation-associated protein 4 [Leptolyngbya sp. PCC 6406]|uniref:DNA phosphorothioation-associated protein 4 n=1 Tax=Leptolyngbya sp. PCC 6406 TaxID=1173264 RepID=UPI0002ACC553|nr:DNA phosphorothioation-associated protein 4 [Leptolyngbya sp. PCC 6406]
MADIRIKVAKDKAKLVKALRAGEGSTGPFQTYVDLMIFAACLGVKRDKYIPIEEASRKDPDPIPWDHFASRNKSQILNLLAVSTTQNPKVLGNSERSELDCVEIFEGYANGGLSIIQEAMLGSSNYTSQLQLLLLSERQKSEFVSDLFDISLLED